MCIFGCIGHEYTHINAKFSQINKQIYHTYVFQYYIIFRIISYRSFKILSNNRRTYGLF